MITYNPRRHFADLLHEEMGKNPDIWVITADLGYKMWDKIKEDYPERFINCGAAEQLMMGIAIGLAQEGKLPVVYSITPFLLFRPTEWIRNYLNHENCKVKMVGSGIDTDYAHDGFSHFIFNTQQYMDYFPKISCFFPEKHETSMLENFKGFMEKDGPSLIILRR